MTETMNITYTPVKNVVLDFLSNNWVNLLLIIVGTFALLIYVLQERRKVTEAASLVVTQIDEIQDRIKDIRSFISNGQLNNTAFYESQILFGEDYWKCNKHHFIKKMDSKSFRILNSFYDCASEIQEQQQLMKNLQKNSFFVNQQVLANIETSYIISGLSKSINYPVDFNKVASAIEQNIPSNLDEAQRAAFENWLRKSVDSNSNIDFSMFWNDYNQNRTNVINVINQNGLTTYIPEQIRLSLEKALNEYALLEVTGCDGYRRLKKMSERKF